MKQVVDGQQRSTTVWTYLDDSFRMSAGSEVTEAAGRKYSELPDDLQHKLLDYLLNFDLFVATSQEEVREVFRRINSFTVPLNAEEQRYAEFQGEFKWFIHRLAREYDILFVESGLISSKQLARMTDTKWLSEISHAVTNGITTTNKTQLTALYRKNDRQLPRGDELYRRFQHAFDLLLEWEDLHKTVLFKPLMAYSLVLAIMHCQDPIDELQSAFPLSTPITLDPKIAIPALTNLASISETEDTSGPYADFVTASTKGTNVKAARETRFRWLCRALSGQ
jgi:hypothetical protein